MNKPEFVTTTENPFAERYDNFIGGKWAAPRAGKYFDNISPVTGQMVCKIARSDAQDIEAALDAAHAAKDAWGRTSVAERANVLNRIADRMEANLELLAVAETWDNGKPIRETRAADLPLAIDHFRYFAGVVRAQEGSIGEIDDDTIAYHFHEPLGVVGQIIPWNFPLLMACWKLAPALAAGNCVVLKPAEQTPASIMVWAEIVGDLLPPGVLNIVNGFGLEAGKQLAKILSYIDIGKQEGAKVLAGGGRAELAGDLAGGFYVQPTVFEGHNKMRIFQEEIFGPVVSVTTFKTDDEALAIANDTLYGLGAGVS